MQTQRMLGIRMLIKTPSTASARQRLTGASLSGRQTSRLRTNFSFPVSCVKPAARPQQRHAYATESEHIEAAEDSDGDYVDDEELTFQEADDLDPEGRDATLEDFYTPRDGTPQALLDELYSDVVYGPPAVVLAGFRAEEFAMVRAVLDAAGAADVKVLPAKDDMLYERVGLIIGLPEPDWAAPRPPESSRGGDWGAQRTILFSGMRLVAQAALVELLEEAGLPPVCAALATEDDADTELGVVLAEAVQAQRSRRNPRQNVWEGLSGQHVATKLPNMQEFLQARAQDIQREVEAGHLDRVIVRDEAAEEEGAEITLADLQARRAAASRAAAPDAAAEWDNAEAAEEDASEASVQEDAEPLAGTEEGGAAAAVDGPAGVAGGLAQGERSARGAVGSAASAQQGSTPAALGVQDAPQPSSRFSAAGMRPKAPLGKEQRLRAPPVGSRPKQAPARLELRDAVLADPVLPPGAAARVAAEVAAQSGGPGRGGVLQPEQVQEGARAAGKPFMDSLARNVGQGAGAEEDGVLHEVADAGDASPEAEGSLGTDSLIDDIAAGREVLPAAVEDLPEAVPAPPPQAAPAMHGSAASDVGGSNERSTGTSAAASSSSTGGGSNGAAASEQQATAGPSRAGSVSFVRSSQGKEAAAQAIMNDVEAAVERMRKEVDRDKVTAAMRGEALEPTRDAIKAALACGMRAEDLRRIVDEEAAARDADSEGWMASWGDQPPMMPSAEEVAAARAARDGREAPKQAGAAPAYDIFSPQPVPRNGSAGIETVSAAGLYSPDADATGWPVQAPGQPGGGPPGITAAGTGMGTPGSEVCGEEGHAATQSTAPAAVEGSGQAAASGRQGGTMSKAQLRELAERRGLSYEALLADAAAKGVVLPDA